MRILLTSAATFVAATLMLGLGTDGATAAPLPAMSALSVDASAVETMGWRQRYYRRYGVWPTGPRAAIDDDVVVAEDDDGVVIIAPLRPRSCGEYRYWDGAACVDARYNDPYLGPK